MMIDEEKEDNTGSATLINARLASGKAKQAKLKTAANHWERYAIPCNEQD